MTEHKTKPKHYLHMILDLFSYSSLSLNQGPNFFSDFPSVESFLLQDLPFILDLRPHSYTAALKSMLKHDRTASDFRNLELFIAVLLDIRMLKS